MPPPPDPSSPTRTWLRRLLPAEAVADPGAPHRPGPGAAERRAADRDVRDGLLHRVVGDVVVAADVDLDPAGRAVALALLLPPGAVALGGTAAWVHAGDRLSAPTVLEVALPAPAARRLQREGSSAGVPVTATRSVPPAAEMVEVGPLTVTTAARTLLDVARVTPQRTAQVHRALLEAGLLPAELDRAGAAARGTPHVRQARRLLALAPPGDAPSSPAR